MNSPVEQLSTTIEEDSTDSPGKRTRVRSQVFFWSKIVLTLGVLGLLIATIHPREIFSAFTGARYPLVAISLILVIPNLGMRALKWGYILRQVKPEIKAREVWSNLLIGFTFAVVTPGQLGEFGRAFFIAGRPRLELIGLSFIDKWFNLLAIILGGTAGLLFLPGLVYGRNAYLFAGCTFLVMLLWVVLFLIIMSPRWIRDLLYTINIMLPYRDKIKVLLGGLDPIYRKQALLLALFALLHYSVVLVQFYLLVHSFQAVNFVDSVRASAATLFTKAALPIAIGGLGVGETASVGFYQVFGVGQAAAFNSSVMLFSMNVLLPAVIGFFIMIRKRIVPENPDD